MEPPYPHQLDTEETTSIAQATSSQPSVGGRTSAIRGGSAESPASEVASIQQDEHESAEADAWFRDSVARMNEASAQGIEIGKKTPSAEVIKEIEPYVGLIRLTLDRQQNFGPPAAGSEWQTEFVEFYLAAIEMPEARFESGESEHSDLEIMEMGDELSLRAQEFRSKC
jgi:hypothetical protein